jgi:hypothetical protein
LQVGKAVCQPKTDIDVIWVLPSICITDIWSRWLYTIVGKRKSPMESEGWTGVIMDRPAVLL